MKQGRLIVCEKRGIWAAALRREVTERVYETRSLAACWQELVDWPCSFLVLELTRDVCAELTQRLAGLDRDHPNAAAVVVAGRRLRALQWLIRESGAAHFTASPRCLEPVAQMARRHLAAAPQADLPPTQRILASLPWTDSTRPAGQGPSRS